VRSSRYENRAAPGLDESGGREVAALIQVRGEEGYPHFDDAGYFR
jgi:hypothetical protein